MNLSYFLAAGFAPMGSCVQKPAAGPSRLQKHVPEQWTVALQVPRQTPKAFGDVVNWRAETIPAEKTVSKVTANMSFLTIDTSCELRKARSPAAAEGLQASDRLADSIKYQDQSAGDLRAGRYRRCLRRWECNNDMGSHRLSSLCTGLHKRQKRWASLPVVKQTSRWQRRRSPE